MLDIGLCGTEEVYYGVFSQEADGGVMVTASHNPKDYNGLKFVREQAKPISADTGLADIERRVHDDDVTPAATRGERRTLDQRDDYVDFLLAQIKPENFKPLKIVVNPGNGCAGLVVEKLAEKLPFEIRAHAVRARRRAAQRRAQPAAGRKTARRPPRWYAKRARISASPGTATSTAASSSTSTASSSRATTSWA